MQKNNEENLDYYYNPKTEEDFVRIAEDRYGNGIRDNSKSEKIELGKNYHYNGDNGDNEDNEDNE